MKTTTNLAIIATGAAVVAFIIYRSVPKLAAAAGDAAHAVNPLNPENVFATGVNNVGAVLAGQAPGSWSLGSWLYDVTHPDEARELGLGPTNTGGASGNWGATDAELETARLLARYPAPASVDAYERPASTSSGASGSW